MEADKYLPQTDSPHHSFEKCWEFIKQDLIKVREQFHCHESFNQNLNNTFIVFIPKKQATKELRLQAHHFIRKYVQNPSKTVAKKKNIIHAFQYVLTSRELMLWEDNIGWGPDGQ